MNSMVLCRFIFFVIMRFFGGVNIKFNFGLRKGEVFLRFYK